MEEKKRFDFNAKSHYVAQDYIENRAIQLLKFDVVLTEIKHYPEGVVAMFNYGINSYQAIYILKQHRNKGNYKKLHSITNLPVITTTECKMLDYLKSKGYLFTCLKIEEYPEYKLIQNYYGDKRAKRSGLYYMNHIDEGIAILRWLKASKSVEQAYCLHPLFQMNEDLALNVFMKLPRLEPNVLILVMEYRAVANNYLSYMLPKKFIELSPLAEVNQMLVADKIQNRKDFELHHKGVHKNSNRLDDYFKDWMNALNISEEKYKYFMNRLRFQPLQSKQLQSGNQLI